MYGMYVCIYDCTPVSFQSGPLLSVCLVSSALCRQYHRTGKSFGIEGSWAKKYMAVSPPGLLFYWKDADTKKDPAGEVSHLSVLYCTVLYCTVLYCNPAVHCSTVLHSTLMYRTVLTVLIFPLLCLL